ncbi:MAG: potassium transporter, partial [Sphingomonadales bacterium]
MTDFLLLAFILLIAGVIAVPIATRFGLGSVLGYLLAGMVLSPLLGVLGVDVEGMQQFAEFGVVMMLFIIGLELEPKRLWAMRNRLMGLGGGQVVLTSLLITGISLLSGYQWQTALAIGMILALSSTAIVLQTLEEKNLMRTQGGEASFSVLLVQDVAVIPIIAILPLLALPELVNSVAAHSAEAGGHGGPNILEGLPAWLSGIATLAAIGFVAFAGAFLTRPVFRFIASSGLRELFTAAALMFVIGIALLMVVVGLSPALGAFIAGVVLANSEYRHELEADINPFKSLLLGLFFITVGASIDFAMAIDQFGAVLFWTVVLIAAKILVLFGIGKAFHLSGSDRWLFSLGLAQAGEFGFVLVSLALGSAVLSGPQADLLLLIIAFSMLVTPLLFILYDKLIVPIYSKCNVEEADTIDESNEIILAGRGRVGGIVDRMLDAAGYKTTVIDYDSRHIANMEKFGTKAYFGDATRPDLLESAGIANAKLLIIALDEKEQINTVVSYVMKTHPKVHVIARAIDRDHVYKLWALGCRDIIRETYDGAIRIGRSAFEALGHDRQASQAMADAWEEMDRSSMVEIADV